MSLEFTLVRRAISLAVIDGPDADDNPDILQAQGSVLFEPVIKKGDSIQVQTRGGSETYALAPIECPINDGIISHRGQDGVKLPAGGEAANPSLIRWKATFSRMQAGGKSFTLAPVIFDAVPGGEIDLTMVAPVAGAPEGVVRGPRGTSLESIIVDGSELVFTAVDDAGSFEIARIPLDEMVRAEADAAADGVRDALAVDVAAAQSARDAAEGHANRAATSESNAATSESAAKQSETNAGDYAAVATTAATEAVDAMERATDLAGGDFATHEYVDSVQWKKPNVTSTDTLDSLPEGTRGVNNSAIALSLGIPYGVRGNITIHDIGDARTASYITNHATNPREYINSRVSGVWSGWSRHASAGDLETKADKSSITDLATKKYVDDSIAGISPSDPPAPAVNMALLGAPVTPWESAGIVTNYAQGELYLEQVTTQIANVQRVKIGSTHLGKDITALVVGDTSKPVVMLEGGIHGNEVAPREALFMWARKAAQYRTWMDDICLVIIPTINGDRTGHNRENAQGVDINRSFGDASTSEAQAVISAFDTYNPVFYISCHEFEHSTSENEIETGNTDFEGLAENIRTESVRVESAIWQAVQALGASVGSYPASQIPGPDEPITTARTWVSVVKNTPAVLIETGGGLYPKTYANHIGVHPARYTPPLGWRVDLYHAALDASLDEISYMIQEQVIQ